MKHGPLNNTMSEGSFAFGKSDSDGKILAFSLNTAVENYWAECKARQPLTVKNKQLWESATYAAAARVAGGGVCASISYVTMGVLTQRAHNIIACIYYSDADHSFVLIRKPTTHWFVVDPWVRNPSVCPWKYNYFGPSGGSHMLFYITHPVAEPFGMPIPASVQSAAEAKGRSIGVQIPFERKLWGHSYNVQESMKSVYPPICGPKEWGDQVAPHFDTRSLWA